jgi:class 3 adenylate cyclase
LFVFCAVADIAGFTAWSSIRDPHQVFALLEAIFQGFDSIAKRQRIFKVETIGDCYVGASSQIVRFTFGRTLTLVDHTNSLPPSSHSSAVCGVPKANKDHAVMMARFARDAMDKFREVVRNLELTLGPDTVGKYQKVKARNSA